MPQGLESASSAFRQFQSDATYQLRNFASDNPSAPPECEQVIEALSKPIETKNIDTFRISVKEIRKHLKSTRKALKKKKPKWKGVQSVKSCLSPSCSSDPTDETRTKFLAYLQYTINCMRQEFLAFILFNEFQHALDNATQCKKMRKILKDLNKRIKNEVLRQSPTPSEAIITKPPKESGGDWRAKKIVKKKEVASAQSNKEEDDTMPTVEKPDKDVNRRVEAAFQCLQPGCTSTRITSVLKSLGFTPKNGTRHQQMSHASYIITIPQRVDDIGMLQKLKKDVLAAMNGTNYRGAEAN